MSTVVIGLSHRTAPLTLRERVALGSDDLRRALECLKEDPGNGVILSTCNRTELYFVPEPGVPPAGTGASDLLARLTGVHRSDLQECCYLLEREAAVRHLHRVAGGLDSMIFGEAEILGQIRHSLQASREVGVCNNVLTRLFHSAIRAGRRIQNETFVGRHDRSVASAAVALARDLLGDIKDRQILIVGAGNAGTATMRTLSQQGARRILLANRTLQRAEDLAQRLHIEPIPLAGVPEALYETDLVICCASDPDEPLIRRQALMPVLAERPGQPIVFVDMSVPRCVDPSVRELPDVHLFDIEDLRKVCPVSPDEREREVEKANGILDEEVLRFDSWWRSLPAVPTITQILAIIDETRSRELEKTLRRLPPMSADERDRLEALTRAIVKKVLHQPITHLKRHSEDTTQISMMRNLFGLEEIRNAAGRSQSADVA